jgi:hypothetical protein
VGHQERAIEVLSELTPERCANLGAALPEAAAARIRGAMADLSADVAHDIAFHLTDWAADAAFLVALVLSPEKFTDAEVRAGIRQFLIHAPNHVCAAAKLADEPVRDIFGVGALDEGK